MTNNEHNELSILERRSVTTNWREHAQWRRENRHWLRYSGFIALKVMKRIEELGIRQKELAEKLGCSPQYISRLLKGTENLTLETISKLEDCLQMDILHKYLKY